MLCNLLNYLQSSPCLTYFAASMEWRKTIWALLPLAICYLLSLNKPFFWDTVHLASAQAQWFFDHGQQRIWLPDDIDSGHPPLTGWLLSWVWKGFGKGLIQSHLMMLPFLLVAAWHMLLTLRHYFPHNFPVLAYLFFLNPILLTQAMLVSPDIILFAGLFTCLVGILRHQWIRIVLGSMLLALVSMRGMVCVAALAVFGLLRAPNYRTSFLALVRYILYFLPAGILAFAFLYTHYQSKGWFGYHVGSPWAPSFVPVGFSGFLKNLAVLAWRFADQGMLFLWIFPLALWLSKRNWPSGRTRELLTLFTIFFALLVVPQLIYKGLLMHRYLYPCIAALTLVAFSVVTEKIALKNYVIATGILLCSGFFWIYPDLISKGWDIMPLHYSYYHHRGIMMEKMRLLNISPYETGAGFPYEMSSRTIDLGDDDRHFASPSLPHNNYVLYSNISNDFSADEIHTLQTSWQVVAASGKWPVYFVLYKKP